MMAALWTVWLGMNAFVFILYGADKRQAVNGGWRIPERTLLLGTWLLGGAGAFAAMRIFRHKTRKLRFQLSAAAGMLLSVALLMAAHAALLGWI